MSLCITCHVSDDLEKLGQGQIDLMKFQSAISQQPLKIQTCGCKHTQMMSVCITCHMLDDLEKLGQGQIGLEKFQFGISL